MNEWMNNPNLSGIDPAKLSMLQSLAAQGSTKNQSELLPFLMAASSNTKKKGMSFTPQEMTQIIEVLKVGKSKQETNKIDHMINLLRKMNP